MTQRLVLLGAGHAHVEVLRRFAAARPEAEIVVVTRRAASAYSGMLPGVLMGRYAQGDLEVPVAPLAERAGARLIVGEAVGLDPEAREVRLRSGQSVGYDLLSLDTGSVPATEGMPEGPTWLPIKPIEDFLERLPAFEAALPEGARVGMMGGGAAGLEVAVALAHRWEARGVRITIIERGAAVAPGLPARARRLLGAALAARGVAVRTGAAAGPAGFDGGIWATGAAAPGWVAASGLATDGRGFLSVDAALRSLSGARIFAAGDVASMAETPRPKAGVFAVRQGPVLAENLRAALAGLSLAAYRPQTAWLNLIALGPDRAMAVRNGVTVAGRWVWRWKDRIDRGWIARYR